MQYIDKSKNAARGNDIVNQLLDDCWDAIDNEYKYANYDDLCRPKYRSNIIPLMLNEQDNVCCYCMRQLINNNTTTIEHIIPNKSKPEDVHGYLDCDVLNNNVIHRNEFDLRVKIIPPAKYPHDIAYYNLIASCDSKSHCNNYRGDEKLQPLIYDPEIGNKVEYDKAGRISGSEYEDDLERVGVSIDNRLVLIRLIWFKLSQEFNDLSQITENVIDDFILELIPDFDDTKLLESFTGEPSYKAEVIKFNWFYQYYKNN